MRRSWLALTFLFTLLPAAYGQTASPFTLYVHDTTGVLPDTPLPAIYQLASTPVGGYSPTVIKMINTSGNKVFFATSLVSTAAGSAASNANFSVTGVFDDQLLGPGASVLYTVNFTPTATGLITGYLNLAYQVQQNGCVFSGTGTVCPGNITSVSTLSGTATAPQFTLSYQSSSGPVVLTPSSSSPLNFPNTPLSATSTITFTLTNPTNGTLTVPVISLPVINTNEPSAFSLDTSAVPATIDGGQSADFDVTFAPGQVGLGSAVLQVGSNTYPIQGYGIVVATIDELDITYTNSTGVLTRPEAATPIPFGQILPGSGTSVVLTFNVQNPIISANPVTVPAVTISGAGFTLSRLPALPTTLTPGDTNAPGSFFNFAVAFTPTSVGTFPGNLSIGGRSFALKGVSISSAIPGLSITTSGTMGSQQQLNLTVQTSAPSPVTALGTLSLQFTPSVADVTHDAAILFTKTGGQQLNISLGAGAQTATYANQSSIPFATGTTAGTITFSVAFPSTTTYSQSFTIPSAIPQFSSVQATRENPNLVLAIEGYDNTYSAGPLSFTFYDTSGKVIGNPISFDATASFRQLFFIGNNDDGGLFSLHATFPVTGDVTKVGSVTASLSNSSGKTTTSATFQ